MKKNIFTPLFLFFIFTQAMAQPKVYDYSKVDAVADAFDKSDYKTPELLAVALAGKFTSQRDKARALYTFLAKNMKYNADDMDRGKTMGEDKEDVEEKKEEKARQCFKKGKGICEDYSRVYRMMCKSAGIECLKITGVCGHNAAPHAWNSIKLDNQWYLVDVTWGAGYLDDNERFHYRFGTGFFCTNPQLLILDHFPKDTQWQLMPRKISRQEYPSSPKKFRYAFYGIVDCTPFDTLLKSNESGEVEVFFTMEYKPNFLCVKINGKFMIPTVEEKGEKTILKFQASKGKRIEVFAGEGKEHFVLIGTYKT
jgi:hypothetical protein